MNAIEIILLVISLVLIILVLLQAGKAETTSGIISGDTSTLFTNRKERGSELFISRLTLILGLAYFAISLAAMFI